MKKLMIAILALLVIAPALQAAEISYTGNIAWWGEVKKTTAGAYSSAHNSWPGGMEVQRWGDLGRGFITCNWAGNMTDPFLTLGIYNYLVSANLQMDMTYVHQAAGFDQPGVYAEWILQADTTWGGNYTVGDPDFDAPVGISGDLGWLVAPGDLTTGVKTIDVTAALQQASDEFQTSGGVRPYFYVRLRLGSDTDASNPDAQGDLNGYYVFNTSGANPPGTGFNMTLSDTNPIPEPSIMAIGLVALLSLRRKK